MQWKELPKLWGSAIPVNPAALPVMYQSHCFPLKGYSAAQQRDFLKWLLEISISHFWSMKSFFPLLSEGGACVTVTKVRVSILSQQNLWLCPASSQTKQTQPVNCTFFQGKPGLSKKWPWRQFSHCVRFLFNQTNVIQPLTGTGPSLVFGDTAGGVCTSPSGSCYHQGGEAGFSLVWVIWSLSDLCLRMRQSVSQKYPLLSSFQKQPTQL